MHVLNNARGGLRVLKEISFCQVDQWPWIKFFTKSRKKGYWVMNDIQHTVLSSDVEKQLQPPNITMCGLRILYYFPGTLSFMVVGH